MIRHHQSGNAMVYILIAVLLFAALAYTFLKSGQTGQGSLSKEQSKIAAGQILSFANNVEKAVEKLRQRGCSENQISFVGATTYAPGNYTYSNANAPSDNSCDVFNANGGGVIDVDMRPYMTAEASRDMGQTLYTGSNSVSSVDLDPASPQKDLLMIVSDLDPNVCTAINDILGVTGPTARDGFHVQTFVGTYGPLSTGIGDDGSNPTTVRGRTSFCMQNIANSLYRSYYVRVLIVR